MYRVRSRCVRRSAKSFSDTPKFFASTDFGVCANQSEIRKVESSEKPPSSNTRRNSHPSANPWISLENSVDSSWLSASSSENYYRRNHNEGEGQDNDAYGLGFVEEVSLLEVEVVLVVPVEPPSSKQDAQSRNDNHGSPKPREFSP